MSQDMEGLINQAFAHIENLDEPVQLGRYDLVNPDNETIIMPELWESTVEPGMQITMMLWPIPEPEFPEEGEPPENREIPPGEILTLEDMMNMTTSSKKKGESYFNIFTISVLTYLFSRRKEEKRQICRVGVERKSKEQGVWRLMRQKSLV